MKDLETTDEAKLNKRIKNDTPLFAESKLNIQGEKYRYLVYYYWCLIFLHIFYMSGSTVSEK